MNANGADRPDGSTIRLRGFALDLRRRELRTPAGELAVLRPKALELLLALGEQAGHVVTKDALMARVWPRVVVTEDSITQLVNEIRRLLGDAERRIVRTVPRRGYALRAEAAPPGHGGPAHASTNLPVTLPTLYGRERDLGIADALLREHRLVTLTGPGGIGKTVLASTVGRGALPRFPDGVWLIDLAARTEAAEVLPAIATAAGIEPAHEDTLGRLMAELSTRDTLLILDNCEHLVGEVARLCSAIVASTHHVRLLATSQVPLRLGGEAIHRLDVLAVPPEDADAAVATRLGAFRLFVARVREASRDAELDERETAIAIDICRRLDGVPLALEMAAARVPSLGLAGVRDRLGERLRLLRAACLQPADRHETLRATLEWSCSQLDATEVRVLRRLSVFSGSFDFDTARRVIEADDIDEWASLDALCGLVDKSLVRADGFDPVRYRLLESTRMHARELLVASGELEATLDRHARSMADCSRVIQRLFNDWGDEDVLARIGIYTGALDRALDRFIQRSDLDHVASTLLGIRWIAQLTGDQASMSHRLHKVHPLLSRAGGMAKARLLTIFASCQWLTINDLSPLEAAEAALSEWRRLPPDPNSLSHALNLVALHRSEAGRTEDAQVALDEGLALCASLRHPRRELVATILAGQVKMNCGDPLGGLHAMTSAMVLARSLRATRAACYIQAYLPEAALMAGQADHAVAVATQAVGDLRSFGQGYLAAAWESLVLALLRVGEVERAGSEATGALPLAWDFGFERKIAMTMALYAVRTGRSSQAAELLGFVMPRLLPLRNAVDRWRYGVCEATRAEIEREIGPGRFAEAFEGATARDADAAFEIAAKLLE